MKSKEEKEEREYKFELLQSWGMLLFIIVAILFMVLMIIMVIQFT